MSDGISSNAKQNSPPATSESARLATEALRQNSQAAQQNTRATTEAVRSAAAATAEATKRNTEAGTEAVNRANETAKEAIRKNADAVAGTQREIVERATSQLGQINREIVHAVQSGTEDLQAIMTIPHAASEGLQDMQKSMSGFVQGIMHTNLQMAQEFSKLANPSAMIELQQRFLRSYMDAWMQGTATFVRATRRTAEETLRPIEEKIEQRQTISNQKQQFSAAAE